MQAVIDALIHPKIAYDVGDGQIVLYVQLAGFPPLARVRLVGKFICSLEAGSRRFLTGRLVAIQVIDLG